MARKNFILQNFKKYIDRNSKIIEIGAGTGNVSRNLQQNGYENISVGEMHLNGLKYAKSYGMKDCYQFDLLDTPFENEFDVVCMFDILEHIPNDNEALKKYYSDYKDDLDDSISLQSLEEDSLESLLTKCLETNVYNNDRKSAYLHSSKNTHSQLLNYNIIIIRILYC